MDVRPGFGMHCDDVGAGLRELGDVGVDRRNHQVHIKGQRRAVAQGRDHIGADRNVRNEMAVHDIDMDVIGARFVNGLHFVAEAREICGEDRRRDPDGLLHDSVYQLSEIAASAAAHPSR